MCYIVKIQILSPNEDLYGREVILSIDTKRNTALIKKLKTGLVVPPSFEAAIEYFESASNDAVDMKGCTVNVVTDQGEIVRGDIGEC